MFNFVFLCAVDGWMCWAEVSGTNFGRLLATSAAKCPHSEDKKRCGSFTGNTVQNCGLCKGNAR